MATSENVKSPITDRIRKEIDLEIAELKKLNRQAPSKLYLGTASYAAFKKSLGITSNQQIGAYRDLKVSVISDSPALVFRMS